MNTLRNSVRLIGNLGQAPDIKNLDSGRKMAKFSLATNETYTNQQGERVTETSWHSLVAWGKTAEIVEKFLTKGTEVAIEGKLHTRKYTDKDGGTRYFTEIVVSDLTMVGRRKETEQA